jgi:hypothetical protein
MKERILWIVRVKDRGVTPVTRRNTRKKTYITFYPISFLLFYLLLMLQVLQVLHKVEVREWV